jgi:hypothetical protein
MFHPGDSITVPFHHAVSSMVILRDEADEMSPVSIVMPDSVNGVMVELEKGSG